MSLDPYSIADTMTEDAKTRLRKFAKSGAIKKEALNAFLRQGLIETDEYDSYTVSPRGSAVLKLIGH